MVQRTQILELIYLVVDTKMYGNSQSRELLMGYKNDNICNPLLRANSQVIIFN